ncbi:hypothetical protein [Paracoccus pantotrophus]|uniref:hypothetical protein n=1 Tax=Paracoccus pantotrophus TaxID=82367 RepID=UPI00142EC749|nr:hypothetical protein [Paracoccus pantotrophus]
MREFSSSAAFELNFNGVGNKLKHGTAARVYAGTDDPANKDVASHRCATPTSYTICHSDLLRLAAFLGQKNVQFRLPGNFECTRSAGAGLTIAHFDLRTGGSRVHDEHIIGPASNGGIQPVGLKQPKWLQYEDSFVSLTRK